MKAKRIPSDPKVHAISEKTAAELKQGGRLARIAGAFASGATVTEIAEREGISRTITSRHVNSEECRQLIAEFVSDEMELMRGIFYRAIHVIEQGFDAVREYPTKDGQVFLGGPDHYARLSATKHFRDFLSSGRPAARLTEEDKKKRTFTLEDIEEIIANGERESSRQPNSSTDRRCP